MPSPIGHMLAGLTVALAGDQREQASPRWPDLFVWCALLAAAPDLDLLVPGTHRTFTHSLPATALVMAVVMVWSRRRLGRVDWRLTICCTLAYGSHLLADYFGVDYGTTAGIQLFWPVEEWYISGWSMFRGTERHDPLSAFAITRNSLAIAQELLIIGPMLLLVWLRRRRTLRLLTAAASGTQPSPPHSTPSTTAGPAVRPEGNAQS